MTRKRKILSDKDLHDRLIHMGLLIDKRTVNPEIMPVFAGIIFGLFIWDLNRQNSRSRDSPAAVYELFCQLREQGDFQNMYLMLSVQYDLMGKALPDPIWWLMCSEAAVEGFMRCFMERFDAHMGLEGGEKNKTD